MANVTYTSVVAATAQNRARVYESIAVMCAHLIPLGIDLVSISKDVNSFVLVTVTGAISQAQRTHLGLQ